MYVKPFDAILDIINRLSKFALVLKQLNLSLSELVVNGHIDK